MFAMSRQLKGALMAAGGGVCWGISGTMGQYLFTHEGMQTTWLIPIRLGLAGLILFVYWLVKDRRLLFAPWRQRSSAVMLALYGVFGISLSQFLYFLTIQFSNAAIGTIMQDKSPVMVLLVACATAHTCTRAQAVTLLYNAAGAARRDPADHARRPDRVCHVAGGAGRGRCVRGVRDGV